MPRARLHTVRGGGHLVLMDSAPQVGPLITSFLQGDRATVRAAEAPLAPADQSRRLPGHAQCISCGGSMKVLIVGAGVVGTVYGAHLAAAGSTVEVLRHGPRTDEVAAGGLNARDVTDGGLASAEAAVVPEASGSYDIVLIAVRRDQLASACAGLTGLAGNPAVLFLGNNPAGRAAIGSGIPGDVYLRFPGIGGVMTGGTAEYVRIRQQSTAVQETADPRLAAFESALTARGFAVQRVPDMDGWLAYHAAFVACITAALYRCGTDPVRLARTAPP